MTTITRPKARYLSCAETAQLVRTVLKREFPGVKFSVKSSVYAGGASITVRWTDGPNRRRVERLLAPYRAADFDSMIDLKVYRESWLLPDGTAHPAYSLGSDRAGGTLPAYDHPAPDPAAELVHMGADFVEAERKASRERYQAAVRWVCERRGLPVPEVALSETGRPYLAPADDPHIDGEWLSSWVYRRLEAEE